MESISTEIVKEIERQLAAGPYGNVNELLRDASAALDSVRKLSGDRFEAELLRGLEGDDVEMTAEDWDDIEREPLQ